MNVLAIVHSERGRAGIFGDAVTARGYRLDEWRMAAGGPPARPLVEYGAVLTFGGGMQVDQEDRYPWLRDEDDLLRELLAAGTPVLGVCLGAQLVAKAAGAAVYEAAEPEIGWIPVELSDAAAEDPVFARLPRRFLSFQWHYYTYELPASAVELARSAACPQAFRLGDAAWAIQFHAEVTADQLRGWAAGKDGDIPGGAAALLADTERHIGAWNALGRSLCGTFLDVAERVGAPA